MVYLCMESASVRHLVILLAFSFLIVSSSHARPSTTRVQRLLPETTEGLPPPASDNIPKFMAEGAGNGRMDLEWEDYSGSGPNDRHTPKPGGWN